MIETYYVQRWKNLSNHRLDIVAMCRNIEIDNNVPRLFFYKRWENIYLLIEEDDEWFPKEAIAVDIICRWTKPSPWRKDINSYTTSNLFNFSRKDSSSYLCYCPLIRSEMSDRKIFEMTLKGFEHHFPCSRLYVFKYYSKKEG